jgi:hypothetical protein
MNMTSDRSWIHRLPWRRKGKDETKAAQIKFRPELQIINENGWANLSIALVNQSSFTVWIEHTNIALADLDAKFQAPNSTGHFKQQILQNVGAKETLNVSLANAVYDAAGRPQGPYTCLLLVNVRYWVFDEWCDVRAATCRIAMTAIHVTDLASARWYDKKMKNVSF